MCSLYVQGVFKKFVAWPWRSRDTRVFQCMRILQVNIRTYVTQSREMRVTCRKISIPSFWSHFLITSKCFNLMQTSLELDVWLQSYEEFANAKHSINKRIWTLFLPLSQKQYLRHPAHSYISRKRFSELVVVLAHPPWRSLPKTLKNGQESKQI